MSRAIKGIGRFALATVLGVTTVLIHPLILAGDDFRVENRVFFGNEREPRVETTTIFLDGVVYDILAGPSEITVFDPSRGRFALLDTVRKLTTDVTSKEIEGFLERMKERAGKHENPFVAFQAHPKFEMQYDDTSRELTFTSPWMIYRLVTQDAESKEIARQYREFSDWYARLNYLLNPNALLPFARLIVNAELAQREAVPRQVHLTLTPPKEGVLPQRTTLRSLHHLVRHLVESDRSRVNQIHQYMGIFKKVSYEEYRRREQDG